MAKQFIIHSRAFIDLTGKTFGRLKVIERAPNSGTRACWFCRCECGVMREIAGHSLRSGKTRSCGCLNRELFVQRTVKHGNSYSVEYRTWQTIKERCFNPKRKGYEYYGGRGIIVCDKWRHSFEAFLADIGPRPSSKHSIDRYPDNKGNYEPGNVRWATWPEQVSNRRKQRWHRRPQETENENTIV